MNVASRISPAGGLQLVLQHRVVLPSWPTSSIRKLAGLVHGDRLLVAVEVAAGHVRHVAFGVGSRRRACAGSCGRILDRKRRAAVGVAFAQHRVDGAAEHLGVARLISFSASFADSPGSRARCSPALQLLDRSFSCGIEALMFGSLMMLASGLSVSSPSGQVVGMRCASVRRSGKLAMMRPASEMSRVSTRRRCPW
jgi:hypothetical protein